MEFQRHLADDAYDFNGRHTAWPAELLGHRREIFDPGAALREGRILLRRRLPSWATVGSVITRPTPDTTFSKLEQDALDRFLDGDDPILGELRAQVAHVTGVVREFTGHGFFTDLEFDQSVPPCSRSNFELTDVIGSSPQLEHGFMVNLFVRNHLLDWIEGYAFDEPWPEDLGEYQLMTVAEWNSRLKP
jgi:hypothetical protein